MRSTAERLEAELGPEQAAVGGGCQRDIEASPDPGPPVTVGLDGGYFRGREKIPGGTGGGIWLLSTLNGKHLLPFPINFDLAPL